MPSTTMPRRDAEARSCGDARRQADGEGRAAAGGAVDNDGAAVLTDDALDNGEAEPVPTWLLGEEWLKEMRQILGVDAAPGVRDVHFQMAVDRAGEDGQRAAGHHGL